MKLIKFLLLLSLFFNISHASIIALEDDCHHDAVSEYMMEQNIDDKCGDLCDIDHLFHSIAILSTPNMDFDTLAHHTQPTQKITFYHPPFKENTTKPPII